LRGLYTVSASEKYLLHRSHLWVYLEIGKVCFEFKGYCYRSLSGAERSTPPVDIYFFAKSLLTIGW